MATYTAGKPQANEFHVEPGDYRVRVIEAKEDTSKAGNEMIKLKLRVIKSDGTDGPALFDYLVFSEAGFWRVDSFLKGCGHHPGEGVSVNVEADKIIGWECDAKLEVEAYEGKKSNKVVAYIFEADGF